MSILINKQTRVVCQGITGKVGQFHTKGCRDYGTKVIGGVTPGAGVGGTQTSLLNSLVWTAGCAAPKRWQRWFCRIIPIKRPNFCDNPSFSITLKSESRE